MLHNVSFIPVIEEKKIKKKQTKTPKQSKKKKSIEESFALSFPEEHGKILEGKLGFSITEPSFTLLTPDGFEVKTVFGVP